MALQAGVLPWVGCYWICIAYTQGAALGWELMALQAGVMPWVGI